MRVLGVISGTSHDAIETAGVDLQIVGDEIEMHVLGHQSVAFDAEVRSAIAAALPPAQTTTAQLCRLDTTLGQAFGQAAAAAVEGLCGGQADLVVSHGQTVFHWVEDGQARGSLQLGQPAWIAERTGLPVVSDLRARDIARGGHGAPLVSLLDTLLLGPGDGTRAALNLGGIANVTVVAPDGSALAYDTGPGNALIDAAVVRFSDGTEHFDRDGRRAHRGSILTEMLDDLLADPYYAEAPPKSTGKEWFNGDYVARAIERFPGARPEDVVATLTRLTARTVADACTKHAVGSVLVSGGGLRNPVLMAELRSHLPGVTLTASDDVGLPSDAKEAAAFALLGFLTVHGLPATLPSCTGAKAPSVLGSITPGSAPLLLPPVVETMPRRLRQT